MNVEGYRHEIGVYGSDQEFRALAVPFALEGIEAGEPVVFAYDPFKVDLLRQWLPDTTAVTYVTDTGPYTTPAKALAGWRKVVEGRLAAGARRVRIAGNVPHPGYGRDFAGWDRYEAAIDHAMGDLPVWAPCLYDARITPPDVLETAIRRHRVLLRQDGTHHTNADFDPGACLGDFLAPPPDPLESASTAFELVNPSLGQARAMVDTVSDGIIDAGRRRDLVLACSEAVANAFLHGAPPVRVRAWTGERRVVVTVGDEGGGPRDPMVGLLPISTNKVSGRGLWLAHQLDVDVALIADGKGFKARLVASDAAG